MVQTKVHLRTVAEPVATRPRGTDVLGGWTAWAKGSSPEFAGSAATVSFHYVYTLVSLSQPDRHYTGCTTDLASRLAVHNTDKCPHTSKFVPWRIETAVAFRCREKAAAFERYLKSRSGRAFARKHF